MRDLEDWGCRGVRFQTDGEPAMLALQQAIAEGRKGDTVQRNSHAYKLQLNGRAEKAVLDVIGLKEWMLLSLEANVRGRIEMGLL